MTFTDLKVYGLNSTALVASTQEAGITPMLQAAVLILTIIYTSINIYKKISIQRGVTMRFRSTKHTSVSDNNGK